MAFVVVTISLATESQCKEERREWEICQGRALRNCSPQQGLLHGDVEEV